MSAPQLVEAPGELPGNVFSRILGDELRRLRESHGWSRAEFIKRLPSGIGERTQLAYEPAPRGALFLSPV